MESTRLETSVVRVTLYLGGPRYGPALQYPGSQFPLSICIRSMPTVDPGSAAMDKASKGTIVHSSIPGPACRQITSPSTGKAEEEKHGPWKADCARQL